MLPLFKTSLPVFVDEFLKHDILNGFNNESDLFLKPAVNILEGKENYAIEIAVPGFDKHDVKIKLDNKILTVSSEKEMKNDEKETRYLRREINLTPFKRSFSLPETVDAENISATFTNGILSLTIPKKEEAKVKLARQIEIA